MAVIGIARLPAPLECTLHQAYADRGVPRVHERNVPRAAEEHRWSMQVQELQCPEGWKDTEGVGRYRHRSAWVLPEIPGQQGP